jgi:hypothetical protein
MKLRDLSRSRAALYFSFLFVASFLLTTAGLVMAGNQWYCWHWPKNTITVNTAAGGYWGGIISSEFSEWDSGTCVDFTSGSEITGDANFYGNTGWLGLARLLDYDTSTCEIIRAESLMNQSYLDGPSYDETDDRHVTCQEHGHTIGLDHRKSPRHQTCMNDRFLGFPDFDAHDVATVAAITTGCSADDGGGNGEKEKGRKKCTDGIDNDGDGLVDGADPDC